MRSISITIIEIAQQIELYAQQKKTKTKTDESLWRPQRCENFVAPDFVVPETRKKNVQRNTLSKVLAFINTVKRKRFSDGCTIMPISSNSKQLKEIAGSQRNASNLIAFMEEIGLISVENSEFIFGTRYGKNNKSKTYRYYYDNEVKVKEYCQQQDIGEHDTNDAKMSRPKKTMTFLPSIDSSAVRFSSTLHLKKPSDISAAGFEEYLLNRLYDNYPDLEKYQNLAKEINRTYYKDYPEFQICFVPRFTWKKKSSESKEDSDVVRKIGIRASNGCVSAKKLKSIPEDEREIEITKHQIFREDILNTYNLNLEKDVKSSVPRITLSLNEHRWIHESVDIYEKIFKEYTCLRESTYTGTLIERFADYREYIKSMHMRRYFDTEAMIGQHTYHQMRQVGDRQAVYDEMQIFRRAIVQAEGRRLYGSEIFFHESCIYLDVLKELLDNGYFCWECYDAFYAHKDGVSQEEFEAYVEGVVADKANAYIERYYELQAATEQQGLETA